ncbi:sigma-54-dependent Fis family transcriptional regulator [Salipiger sp. IMCC34102]|uniref:GAF domain-containing protein n=1 Tax=Salipiger sp. IMCC34102 TaxID=2510647 RepID=UPI00101BE28B|nr:GAF domain-containing protein [Salipiger sp. IMCC34102]RYH00771.1 sigma-54-dependent Fis family transcriptional regulator [Salipiger sp. IMCC34102]
MRYDTQHVARIARAVGSTSKAGTSPLTASWRRSMTHYGLDPTSNGTPDRIEDRELARRRDRMGLLMEVAGPRMNHLFDLVDASGCSVLLTDASGIVLDRRCTDGEATAFTDWGLHPGADWSEAREGTNGIGTCLAEMRKVIIHRQDHFLARNAGLTCMDAPIFGAEGEVIAALDVSSARRDQSEPLNRLLAAAVTRSAGTIEAAHFRACFPGTRIIALDSCEGLLLAVDRDDLVVGATRAARRALGLKPAGPIVPSPAADLLRGDDAGGGFDAANRSALVRALARADGNASQAARALGIGRATLYRRMRQFGIRR